MIQSRDPKPKAGDADPKKATDAATGAATGAAESLLGKDKGPLSLGKDAAEDVAGSLKIHIKLALEVSEDL